MKEPLSNIDKNDRMKYCGAENEKKLQDLSIVRPGELIEIYAIKLSTANEEETIIPSRRKMASINEYTNDDSRDLDETTPLLKAQAENGTLHVPESHSGAKLRLYDGHFNCSSRFMTKPTISSVIVFVSPIRIINFTYLFVTSLLSFMVSHTMTDDV
ncbi:hypothetical protein PoB_001688900 [Plakobranchus ocellatus]|uniref:Ubiquitin-like domain-containing protein n=1 Tax=Plakobranchus ocellatus TaxID=259542 RepID=A0AAV3Z8Z6_9GAST|nr:hypothetical protein PoB_001688900 [Plakobranchus ocellatus]